MRPPGRRILLGAGALLLLLLLASDVGVWADRGLLPGPAVLETVAGLYRRADLGPEPADLEAERLFGPPPPGATEPEGATPGP